MLIGASCLSAFNGLLASLGYMPGLGIAVDGLLLSLMACWDPRLLVFWAWPTVLVDGWERMILWSMELNARCCEVEPRHSALHNCHKTADMALPR
jgi:hypothetical protein